MNYSKKNRVSFVFLLGMILSITQLLGQNDLPNILLITVDDMNWNSVGAYGNEIKDITPNIDQLAAEGVRFERAYVTASNCSPSRVSIQTGLYPHQSGARGFYYINDTEISTIATKLKGAGYYTGVLNKSPDTDPSPDYGKYWHSRLGFRKVDKYNSDKYLEKSLEFYKQAKKSEKPFYHVVNIADPHKPFYNDPKSQKRGFDVNEPSRIIDEDEVEVPEFLPDLPGVKQDLRNYYNSVKRADDCVGGVLSALKTSGYDENTLIIFISDHGMAFPFAKSSVYENGLHTPLIMKWAGEFKQASKVKDAIVSSIDLFPTIMEVTNLEMSDNNNYMGKSLVPLIKGQNKEEFNYAFGSFDENARGVPNPMRGVISDRWNYVFNAWATGEKPFKSAAMWHRTYKSMKRNADSNPEIKARVEFNKFRTVEELYDLESDPNCLNNLATNPEYAQALDEMRNVLQSQMEETNDYLLEAFENKKDMGFLVNFMEEQYELSMKRAEKVNWKRAKNIAGPARANTMLYEPPINR